MQQVLDAAQRVHFQDTQRGREGAVGSRKRKAENGARRSRLEDAMYKTGCCGMYVWCVHIAVSMSLWAWSQQTSDL